MAAQVQQRERVILIGSLLPARQLEYDGGLLAPPASALAPPFVDQTPRGDGHQPRARIFGNALRCPLERRGEQCLLDGILAGVELSVPPHERAENLRREIAQQALDRDVWGHISGGASMIWRTSIGGAPTGPMKATTREASSIARASPSTSTIQ